MHVIFQDISRSRCGCLSTEKSQRLRLFDPESLGYMLRPNLTDYPVSDFRHWDPWRVLTPIVANELISSGDRVSSRLRRCLRRTTGMSSCSGSH